MADGSVRIVLTRQEAHSRTWAARLRSAGLPCLELPLLQCRPLPWPQDLQRDAFAWVLLTSPTAAELFAAAPPPAAGVPPRLGALGEGTAAALRRAGLQPSFVGAAGDGQGMAREFVARHPGPGAILLPGARRRLAEPARSLAAAGYAVREVALYETVAIPPSELPPDPLCSNDLVFFCSPSAVRAFAAAWTARPACVAIGRTTADRARQAGFATAVAATPDLPGMLRAAGFDEAARALACAPGAADQDFCDPVNSNQESES